MYHSSTILFDCHYNTTTSLTLRGGRKIIAFPEGLETSCYHTATSERRRIRLKADYYYIALRGASIRRSQCGNSEAIFGVAVRYTNYILQQVGGNITKSSRGVAFFLQWRFREIPTSKQKQFLRWMTRNCIPPFTQSPATSQVLGGQGVVPQRHLTEGAAGKITLQ